MFDFYGRLHPKHAAGTVRLPEKTSSVSVITADLLQQFDCKTDHRLLFRKIDVTADNTMSERGAFQLDLFSDYDALEKERQIQGSMLRIRQKYGSNAVLKGTNLLEGATTVERNNQIGGHRK